MVNAIITETENNIDTEIFGDTPTREITKSLKALKDFCKAWELPTEVFNEYETKLKACTKKGQASDIMCNFRKSCLN